jgi:N-methylhydantoinase A
VCYGRGGTDPTITDAALVLGYLDSSNFLGGRLELKKAEAEAAIAAVAERLGKTTEAAAFAAMRISVDNIVKAIGEKTVSKGIDTREIVLVAGGGGLVAKLTNRHRSLAR